MGSGLNLREFREKRRKLLSEWDRLNLQIEEVLDRLEVNGPTVADAAMIEGLRAERHLLLEEYERTADRFVDDLLGSLGSDRAEGVQPD